MKALTLWRPWAWAIFDADKDVENRPWPPPPSLIGQPLLLHNGMRFDAEGAAVIAARCPRVEAHDFLIPGFAGTLVQAGHIAGIVTVLGAVSLHTDEVRGNRADVLPRVMASRWATGPWCWVLADRRRVNGPFVRGRQGLWEFTGTYDRGTAAGAL